MTNTREENAAEAAREEAARAERNARHQGPTFSTGIALDTAAVEDEMQHWEEDGDHPFLSVDVLRLVHRRHINEALRRYNPSDAFYESFDAERMRVIELAVELAQQSPGPSTTEAAPDPILAKLPSGIAEDAFDDIVHDEKSQEATGINNEGIEEQIAYLRSNGWDDAMILAAINES